MRFFAHDGSSTHGPAGIDELLKLPGFDGDTLVCPVGSNDSADWKPALAYPPFKKALLEAASLPATPKIPPMPSMLPAMPAIVPLGTAPASSPFLKPFTPAPAAAPAIAPLAPLPPPPAPAPKTAPCPRCAHANLEDARFCNKCGARMDGQLEDISAPPVYPAPLPEAAPQPAAPPEPAFDAFAHLDPMTSFPSEPAPASLPDTPHRPLQPGKMGQLGAYEDAPSAASDLRPSPAPEPEPVSASASVSAPVEAAVPVWKRPAALAGFAGAAALAAGLAYMTLHKPVPVETVAELSPAAEMPAPAPDPAAMPAPAPSAPLYSRPPETSSPGVPSPRPPRSKRPPTFAAPDEIKTSAAAKPKRARKPRPAPAPAPEPQAAETGGDTFIESRAPEPQPKPKPKGKRAAKAAQAQEEKDPLLEALLTETAEQGAEPAASAEPAAKSAPAIGQKFSLPGLERKVSASDRAPAPPEETAPPPASPDSSALAEPGKSTPPPGIEDEPAKSAEGDQLALVQVHEQFDFCAQLLSQAAYGDHYDTCLCKDTREAAPYRGRRGFYVTAKKKEASGGRLESSAKILSSKIDGGVALVKARWKAGTGDKGRDATQSWKLEDGLWCQAP